MNLEGLTLYLLTQELTGALLGSKIYKIFMPSNHSLLLLLKRERDTTALLADLGGGSPALYIPDKMPENPEVPPSFCMLLRKHFEEGRITKITQSGLDRIITFEVDMLGSSSKIITKKLIFELTGKNSNVIFTQDGQIVDSMKHVSAAQSSYRTILPGREYIAPPVQNGVNIITAAEDEVVNAACALPAANIAKALVAATTGIGKATASELLAAADILPGQIQLEPAEKAALAKVVSNLQQNISQQQNVYAIISRTNQVKTILAVPPKSETNLPAGSSVKEFASVNAAINYAMSLAPIQLPQHEQLQKITAAESAKLRKKLMALENDLAAAQNAEEQRIIADTLMANIYQLKRGQTSAEVMNIYDGKMMTVALSPQLSPTENAQAYYKRYNKYKRAQSEVQLQINAAKEMLDYIASIEVSLLTATTKNEVEEVRQEMAASGLIKEQGKRKNKMTLAKSQPLHIKISDDADVYIGKNNRQNDYVTFSIGGPRDLWLHTKDIPGSHVILKTSLPEHSEEDIHIAVQLAAYFSKGRSGSNVPVDVTQRRYVKKSSGAKPGFVIFTNQTTYYATPDEELVKKYLNE